MNLFLYIRYASSKALWEFSGLDLLRLSKEEVVEICGLPEGIRLHNALHYKITFYLSLANGQYKQVLVSQIDFFNLSSVCF
jgi:hypothetical protein